MGFSHTLVAVHDLSPEDAAARLDRTLGDEVTGLDVAGTQDTPGWCVSPPIDGWTFVVDSTHEILGDEHGLARLSAGTWLLTLSVEEHAMSFQTTCWADGAYTWDVIVNGDGHELFVIGDPPPPFGDLVRDLTEGPDVVYALEEISGPPPEDWDELGFDGSGLPTVRAAGRCGRPNPSRSSGTRCRPWSCSLGLPAIRTTATTDCTTRNCAY